MSSRIMFDFKSNLQEKDLSPHLKILKDSSFSLHQSMIQMDELKLDSLQDLCSTLTSCEVPFEKISLDNNKDRIILNSNIKLPKLTFNLFIKLLKAFFEFNSNSEYEDYRNLGNTIISRYFSQIKIICNPAEPLSQIIEHIKSQDDFNTIQHHYNELKHDEKWSNYFNNNINEFSVASISINTWLHIVRHPNQSLENFSLFLNKLNSKSNPIDFLTTKIPLMDSEGLFLFVITIPPFKIESKENLRVDKSNNERDLNFDGKKKDLDPIKELSVHKENEIQNYWFSIASLILRNVNYALLRFNQLPLEGFNSRDIIFYNYFKPKLKIFSESCYNPELVEAFKIIDRKLNKKIPKLYQGIEYYTYNRGAYLERRYREAEREYIKNSSDKIIRKRFNRRQNKLYEYFNTIILLYKPLLNEIMVHKLASGKYSSITKLMALNKDLKEN